MARALVVFAFFFILPATAEMVAIAAALSDSPDRFSIWFVAFTVAFGTWALAASLTWPWIQPLFVGRLRVGFVVMLTVLIGTFTWLLVTSVDLETFRQDTEVSQQEQENQEQRVVGLLGEDDPRDDTPIFNVEMLRFINAQEKRLDARLAAGRVSSRQAARQRLGIARTRTFITRNMLP